MKKSSIFLQTSLVSEKAQLEINMDGKSWNSDDSFLGRTRTDIFKKEIESDADESTDIKDVQLLQTELEVETSPAFKKEIECDANENTDIKDVQLLQTELEMETSPAFKKEIECDANENTDIKDVQLLQTELDMETSPAFIKTEIQQEDVNRPSFHHHNETTYLSEVYCGDGYVTKLDLGDSTQQISQQSKIHGTAKAEETHTNDRIMNGAMEHTLQGHLDFLNALCRVCGKRSRTLKEKDKKRKILQCNDYITEVRLTFGIDTETDSEGKHSKTLCYKCIYRCNYYNKKAPSKRFIETSRNRSKNSQHIWEYYRNDITINECSVCKRFCETSAGCIKSRKKMDETRCKPEPLI